MDTIAIDAASDTTNPATLLDTARSAVRVGRYAQAEEACQTIVQDHPDQSDAWFLMGLAALRSGKTDLAIPHLRRAVEIRRGYTPYRLALGQALLKTGDAKRALAHFEDSLVLSPLSHEAAFGQANALVQLERTSEAPIFQKHALSLLRRHVAAQFRDRLGAASVRAITNIGSIARSNEARRFRVTMSLARRLERKGQFVAAYNEFSNAHEINPEDHNPLHAMGRLAFEAENYLLSEINLKRAHEMVPHNRDIRCNYGRTLSRMAKHELALSYLESLYAEAPENLRYLLSLGWARYRAGQSQRAILDFDMVLEQSPQSVEAHYGRARALVDAGQAGEAKLWFHRTISLSPDHAGALRELANLKDLNPSDMAFHHLSGALEDPTVPAARRAVLEMAAGASHINCKSHKDGIVHYRRGNLLKDVAFDIEAYRGFVDELITTFDADHFAHIPDYGSASDIPVFVLGMPRSGTSLVEQILASHSAVHGAGERENMFQLADELGERLNDSRSYPGCVENLTIETSQGIAEDFLRNLRRNSPKALRIVDKMPGNFHHVGLITSLFPNARIIHCQRDPRDTCLSIFFGDFVGSHPYSYDLNNLGLYHREYERLMAHWHEVLPGRILNVPYEGVVENQEEWSRKMLAFCGLDWESACLEFHKTQRNVRTRSNVQVRQPIYRSSLARWKAYQDDLEPLLDGLEGRLRID